MLLVSEPFENGALQLPLLEDGGLERLLQTGAGARGRGRTAIVPLPGRPERLHLRAVRHGGLLGGLCRDLLFGLRRPVAELRVNARLAVAGAPVPRPVLVAARRRVGPIWSAAVATIHEEHSVNGAAFLAARPEPERLLRAAAAAGAAVRRFHDSGGWHPDLHVKNLLIRELDGETTARVVDLDRARVVPAVLPRRRMRELMRLYRSLVKRGLDAQVGNRGCARFFAAYTVGDRALRRALLRHLNLERARIALHRLAYPRDR